MRLQRLVFKAQSSWAATGGATGAARCDAPGGGSSLRVLGAAAGAAVAQRRGCVLLSDSALRRGGRALLRSLLLACALSAAPDARVGWWAPTPSALSARAAPLMVRVRRALVLAGMAR